MIEFSHANNLIFSNNFSSKIEGLGLFATKQIEKNQPLLTYEGEIISNRQANKREKLYKKTASDYFIYLFV